MGVITRALHEELLDGLTTMRELYRQAQNTGSEGWDPVCDPVQRAFYEGLVQAERALTTGEADHFHGCPLCLQSKGPENVYNAGSTHRAACHTHQTTWLLGSNLFSRWRDETEEEQRERYREIESYRCIDPPRRNRSSRNGGRR